MNIGIVLGQPRSHAADIFKRDVLKNVNFQVRYLLKRCRQKPDSPAIDLSVL